MEYWRSLILRMVFVFVPVSFIFALFYHPTVYLVSLFFDSVFIGDVLIVGGYSFRFISACIAPYAYYFVLLLILFCKDLGFRFRLKLLVVGWLMVLLMNVFRVIVLIGLTLKYGWVAFDFVHLIWWKFLSGFYVALVWIYLVYHYKVKSIPVYDDFRYLVGEIRKV